MHGGNITHQAQVVAPTAGWQSGQSKCESAPGMEKLQGIQRQELCASDCSVSACSFLCKDSSQSQGHGDPVGAANKPTNFAKIMFPLNGMSRLLLPSVLWMCMGFEASLSLCNESFMCENFTRIKAITKSVLVINSVFCIFLSSRGHWGLSST